MKLKAEGWVVAVIVFFMLYGIYCFVRGLLGMFV
jgi:hypothetical protein